VCDALPSRPVPLPAPTQPSLPRRPPILEDTVRSISLGARYVHAYNAYNSLCIVIYARKWYVWTVRFGSRTSHSPPPFVKQHRMQT